MTTTPSRVRSPATWEGKGEVTRVVALLLLLLLLLPTEGG